MIFPTEAVTLLRGDLEDRVAAGQISEADAYRQALATDPQDPRALRLLALLAEDEEDFSGAETLAWRWLHADPLSHEAFRLIARLLSRDPAQAARAAAYRHLGNEKLHYDPEAEPVHAPPAPTPSDESAEVAAEMEPHRLLHTMWLASTGQLPREVVEKVIACGSDMTPLLTGILNLYAEDLLEDVDDALVLRSLALLGEIGDPRSTCAITPFLALEDDEFSQTAGWALQHMAARKPAEVIRELLAFIPKAISYDLGAIAEHLCVMPAVPERAAAVDAIEGRLQDIDPDSRGHLASNLVVTHLVMDGPASPRAAALLDRYGKQIPAAVRRQMKALQTELEKGVDLPGAGSDITVFDLCCQAFEAAGEPHVRDEPKLGRNDPCWCGSGKKYKKCHLAADESR
jgi:hypothetical protein